MNYPLARNPVFLSVQGEGALIGLPMVFIRLAGCSVGCPLCDTDYQKYSRASVSEIVLRASDVRRQARWAWITGGEPADHDLVPLVRGLKEAGFWVAVATSGHKAIPGRGPYGIDWISVSPHDPEKWSVLIGQEVKVVPGLNGFRIEAFAAREMDTAFGNYFVMPCEGKPETVGECLDWVAENPRWKMSPQAHKQWELP